MKKLKGDIVLSLDDVKLAEDIFFNNKKVTPCNTYIQEEVHFNEGYVLLELWTTDDHLAEPYLTLYLQNENHETILDLDINIREFDNISDLFSRYIFKTSDAWYTITISEEKPDSNTSIEDYKKTIELLNQMMKVKDDIIKEKESTIKKLEAKMKAVHDMRGKINTALKEFTEESYL